MPTGSWTGTTPRGIYKPAIKEEPGIITSGGWKNFDTSLTNIHNRIWRDGYINAVSDYSLSTSGTAAANKTALENAISAAFIAGKNLFIPEGRYVCNPITYTKTVDANISGIKIFGVRSAGCEYSEALTYLDFTDFTNTGSDVGISIINSGTGQIVGLTLEDITLFGPANEASNTTKGLYIYGTSTNSGIRSLRLENVRAERFNLGADVRGPNCYPFLTNGCNFENNQIGLYINKSTVGVHNGLSLVGNDISLILANGTIAQTFNSPILQADTHGVVFDTQTSDVYGITFNVPYFEGLSGQCFMIGYKTDGITASGAGHVNTLVVNSGVYSAISGTFCKSTLDYDDFHSCTFNSIYLIDSDPTNHFTTNSPGMSTVSGHKNSGDPLWVSDGSGNWFKSLSNVEEDVTAASPTLSVGQASKLDSTSNAINATQPDGTFVGQMKTIVMTEASNASTVTVTHHNLSDGEVFDFDAIDDILVLLWNGTEWMTIAEEGIGRTWA